MRGPATRAHRPPRIALQLNFLFLDTLGYESALRLSGHHYARLLVARGHRVMSVSAPVSPFHHLARDSESVAQRFANHRAGFTEAPGGVMHYVPWTPVPVRQGFPFDRNWLARLSERMFAGDLLAKLSAADFAPDVISLQNLTYLPFARRFPKAVLQYRMTDMMDAFSNIPKSFLTLEEEAMGEADLVSITSETFAIKLKGKNAAKMIYAPNGVDVGHFATPMPRPEPYEKIDKPIAVYVGALRAWFDTELLGAAARLCPSVQFVVISPDPPPESAPRGDNITYLPGVLYEDVPAYYQHAAVGIIPFALSRLTAPVNPIKMYECLAAGTPVVASDWGELRRLEAPVSLAGTAEEFAGAVKEASAGDGLADPAAIEKFLAQHSWGRNLDELLLRIDQVRAIRAVEA